MRGQISALWELEKWIFKILLETAQAIALGVSSIFRKFEACTAHSELWATRIRRKVDFSRVALHSSNHRFYNASVVSRIFCAF